MKEGWKRAELGSFCEIYQPKTISKKEMTPEGEYPVFGANGVIGRYSRYNHEEEEVLVTCRGATCGTVNISTPRAWITGNAMVVHPDSSQASKPFISLLLKGALDFTKVITGAAQPQITRQSLAPQLVPLPPLEEQKAIVDKLDRAFAGLETARANAEANLENAKELFQVALDDAIDQSSTPKRNLGELCILENGDRGKNYPGKKALTSSGIPFINAGHISGTQINWAKMDYIPEEHFNRLGRGKVKEGDILFCLRGSLGKFAAIDIKTKGAIASSLVIIRTTSEIDAKYLMFYLSSTICRREIEARRGGAAQPNLGATDLKKFMLPTPSVGQQETIANKLEIVRRTTDRLQEEYTRQLSDLDELKQSLLQKAFAGELT